MGRIRRGWALSKQSWEVLKKDRSLIFFPILPTLFAALATIAIWAPTLLVRGVFGGHQMDNQDPAYYIAGAATAYASTFIAIFFNVALAACAVRSMRGGHQGRRGHQCGGAPDRSDPGMDVGGDHGRANPQGRRGALAEPGQARRGPRRGGVGRGNVFRHTGDSARRKRTVAVTAPLGLALLAATFVCAVVISFISAALSQILRVAVYQFAVTGETVGGFEPRLLQAAFVAR